MPDLDTLATLTRRDVEAAIDRSLTRLGVEQLDLVQFHWWNYAVPRFVEVASWLDACRRAGKLARLGVTNFATQPLRDILSAGIPIDLTSTDREELARVQDASPGPAGDVYERERLPGGVHGSIMRYTLNSTS